MIVSPYSPFNMSTGWIPRAFRRKQDPTAATTFYSTVLANTDNKLLSDPSVAMDMCSGVADLQRVFANPTEDKRATVYKTDKIEDIRLFPRYTKDGDLLGTKARIYDVGTNYTTGKEQIESIDTDFLAIRKFFPDEHPYFSSALANTLVYEGLLAMIVDQGARLTKISAKTEAGPVRWLIDLCAAGQGVYEPTRYEDLFGTAQPLDGFMKFLYRFANARDFNRDNINRILCDSFRCTESIANEIIDESNDESRNLNPNNSDFDSTLGISLDVLLTQL